jgi:serine phosphatase RsbU (regulator of sigma subunit)
MPEFGYGSAIFNRVQPRSEWWIMIDQGFVDIQRSLLPRQRPELVGYEFFDYYRPVDLVSGEYFDYVTRSDGRLAVVVADFCGMGTGVSLLMAFLAGAAKLCLAAGGAPAAGSRVLNDLFCRHVDGHFVTLIMIVLDHHRHEATIVNAGHPAPLWRHADGTVEEPGKEQCGLPLGIMHDIDYHEVTIPVAPGDMLLLYTDGISEGMNPAWQMFSVERLRNRLGVAQGDAVTAGNEIVAEVIQHMGSARQNDDMCLLCLRRSPAAL